MDLHLLVNALVQELGVKLKLVQIPREIMEKNRKSPPPFLEVAVLAAEPVYRNATTEVVTTNKAPSEGLSPQTRTVDIKLTQFPSPKCPPKNWKPSKNGRSKAVLISLIFGRSTSTGIPANPSPTTGKTTAPAKIAASKPSVMRATPTRHRANTPPVLKSSIPSVATPRLP